MTVLMAIGRFFKKIWDWIKNTAWIQPLLIVGIIFGVITSIKPIINAAQKHRQKKGELDTFYYNYRLSLKKNGDSSEAEDFTNALQDVQLNGSTTAFREKYRKLGDKFFVAYVAEECSECETAREGFITFKNNLGKLNAYQSEYSFNMVTIFTDEDKTESTTKPDEVPFYDYVEKYVDFWPEIVGYAEGTHHFQASTDTFKENVYKLCDGDNENFLTPTVFLVELNVDNPGVTEIIFGVEGSNAKDKADFLYDCWEHKGQFSSEVSDQK